MEYRFWGYFEPRKSKPTVSLRKIGTVGFGFFYGIVLHLCSVGMEGLGKMFGRASTAGLSNKEKFLMRIVIIIYDRRVSIEEISAG